MSALNKVRANAENLKMSTENASMPKALSAAITDKKELKEFKSPKTTGTAQVFSNNLAQIGSTVIDEEGSDEFVAAMSNAMNGSDDD